MFHNGSGECQDMDKLAQRVICPSVEAIGHAVIRNIASDFLSLGISRGSVVK